tara:strand:+ start:428 stop:1663 length:1236 start_codon:yes stop_codon:yes gene_type:complete
MNAIDFYHTMDEHLQSKFELLKSKSLNIDLTRGKPGADQLDLSNELLSINVPSHDENSVDLRNYGEPLGIQSARKLASELLSSPIELTAVAEQSSLLVTYQTCLALHLKGLENPLKDLSNPKFICPVPGFDRHFRMLEELGIEIITVPLTGKGIDLNALKKVLEKTDNVMGAIIVPRHSNPSGDVYSDENLISMLEMFKNYSSELVCIFDHAYLLHDFDETSHQSATWKLIEEAKMTSQAIVISSFSKITFGAGGISFFAAGKELFDLVNHQRGSMVVAPDKVNQMRHALFFKSAADVKKHMQEHAKLVKPKFDLVIDKLKSLDDECGNFTIPTGGYFISFNAPKGKAKKIISICKDLGVSLTPAGSTYPGMHDPNDSNIRLAPTFISIEQLEDAIDVFVLSVKIACSENS